MKKTLIAAMMAAALVLTGCGAQETAAPAQDTAAEKTETAVVEEKVEENAAVEAEVAENENDASEIAETEAASDSAAAEADTFVFEFDGVSMYVNQEAAGVLEALGEPNSYFEAASCAFEGLDKMYTYTSFEVDTYPEGDVDYISCIYFLDDLVETPEGVCLYMTQDDMIEAYGEDYTEVNGAFVYSKGNGDLSFIIEDGEIVAIEYKTKVDYD